ncbi:GlxA family transcriptional regulator [Pseudomonas sp. UL073]|uniref:GlxA family transcriptional regulator n=1 Tax=Zestomonas insulae TaxID=2809017 RepID=A0ABS2IKU6_9GAMM|nr:GlxA family transcriptional regulator [Pseudomonas insulae]MBM7062813.1 GlxA family transcriptional regulator [Pseudomonas insulae]
MTTRTPNPIVEIGLLVYPGAQTSAVGGLVDLFEVANRIAGEQASSQLPVLRVSQWRFNPDSQRAERSTDSHAEADSRLVAVLVPPSLAGLPSSAELQPLAGWIREQHAAGATVGAVCLGAFFLAETGLLDGRTVTTHWTHAKALAERYPRLKVEADKPIVDDGDVITTAGLMAWAELGLRLVDRLMGPSIATHTARFLMVEHSDSAQACGSNFAPILSHGDAAVLRVQHWLQAGGAVDVSLAAMAERAGLEERTFLRRFRSATGLKPTEYCQHVRVGRARELLEFTNGTVDHIAWTVGYQDPGAFRSTFKKITGLSPSDYRRRFGVSAPAQPA